MAAGILGFPKKGLGDGGLFEKSRNLFNLQILH